jgi:hypothetical protein
MLVSVIIMFSISDTFLPWFYRDFGFILFLVYAYYVLSLLVFKTCYVLSYFLQWLQLFLEYYILNHFLLLCCSHYKKLSR